MSSPEQPQGYASPGHPQTDAQGNPETRPPQPYAPQPGHGAPQGYAPPQGQAPQGYAPQPPQPPQPGQPQQAPQGQPGAYGGGPTGELVLNLRKPFGGAGFVTPIVTIDGYPATATWGRNSFPAPVGVRQVDVASSYLWTFGRASMPVAVEQGRTSEVHYTGPMWTFGMPGRMGTEEQKRPGTGLFIGLMSVIGAVLLLAILVGIFAGS